MITEPVPDPPQDTPQPADHANPRELLPCRFLLVPRVPGRPCSSGARRPVTMGFVFTFEAEEALAEVARSLGAAPAGARVGRATLAAGGMAGRASIRLGDYRSLRRPPAPGAALFLGNPPYVRHPQIPANWKNWLRSAAAGQGLTASGLAGLHVHFFLATALYAVPGDAGALVTSAEWLHVNYGTIGRPPLPRPA